MSFEARYPGACAYGDRIKPGDMCTYTDDDELAHAECVAVDGPGQRQHADRLPCMPTRPLRGVLLR